MSKIIFPVLILYLCMTVGITIVNRYPFDHQRYNSELFWSYRKARQDYKLIWEILLNYFMLLPYGIMASLYIKKRWVLISGFLLSTSIELIQFFMKRGLFEFDDIVGNTCGVAIGIGIFCLIEKHVAKQKGETNEV